MPEQKNSHRPSDVYTYIAGVVLVLAIVAWGIYSYYRGGLQNNNRPTAPLSLNNVPAASSTPTSAPAAANKLSYGDAIKAYPNRFQFSQCRGTPAIIAVKKGTPVMLDNRDNVTRTIKADTQSFKIGGYNYDVFYPEVLGNLVVTCDGKNRVTLNVEK